MRVSEGQRDREWIGWRIRKHTSGNWIYLYTFSSDIKYIDCPSHLVNERKLFFQTNFVHHLLYILHIIISSGLFIREFFRFPFSTRSFIYFFFFFFSFLASNWIELVVGQNNIVKIENQFLEFLLKNTNRKSKLKMIIIVVAPFVSFNLNV